MKDAIVLIAVSAVGIPFSYALNRRYSAKKYELGTGKALSRSKSLIISLMIWVAIIGIAVLIISFSSAWWIILVCMMIVLFAIAVNRKRNEKKLNG
jgi:Flp pilus assembly protein TadB